MTHNNNRRLYLGVDVGGTKIETALVDSDGRVVDAERQHTEATKGPDHVIQAIIASARKLLQRAPDAVAALGLGIAGQINPREGVLLSSPNLGWHDTALKAPLENGLDISVSVTNDVSAATLGEWQFGAGRGRDDMICVFVGTGVGGGVIMGGRLLEGSEMTATELGHIPLVFQGRKCSCRHQGCLEAYAGGWAIAARAREKIRDTPAAGKMLLTVAGSAEEITAEDVSTGYRQNDPLCTRLVTETGQYLSAAIVGLVNTFNPSLVILGGGIIEGLPELTKVVEETVRNCAFEPFVQDFQVAHAQLGGDAGVVGAAALARAQHE